MCISGSAEMPDRSVHKIPVCQCSEDTRAELHHTPSRLLQRSVQWHHRQSLQAPTVCSERGSATRHRHSSTWPHHTSVEATPLASGPTTTQRVDFKLALLVYRALHRGNIASRRIKPLKCKFRLSTVLFTCTVSVRHFTSINGKWLPIL